MSLNTPSVPGWSRSRLSIAGEFTLSLAFKILNQRFHLVDLLALDLDAPVDGYKHKGISDVRRLARDDNNQAVLNHRFHSRDVVKRPLGAFST